MFDEFQQIDQQASACLSPSTVRERVSRGELGGEDQVPGWFANFFVPGFGTVSPADLVHAA